jgi:hypothetical protein
VGSGAAIAVAPAAAASLPPVPPAALASPVAFATLLVHLAVHRFGQPVLPSSMQPAPGAILLECLINTDLVPRAAASYELPFIRDLFADEPQKFLASRRFLLQAVFGLHASQKMRSGMSPADWVTVMTKLLQASGHCADSCVTDDLVGTTLSPTAATLRRVFFDVFYLFTPRAAPSSADPAEDAATKTAAVSTNTGPDTGAFLVYGEFEVALAAVCVEFNPSPFASVASKIVKFFETWDKALHEMVYAPTIEVAAANNGQTPKQLSRGLEPVDSMYTFD